MQRTDQRNKEVDDSGRRSSTVVEGRVVAVEEDHVNDEAGSSIGTEAVARS